MVTSNDYNLNGERENVVLILPQQDYLFGQFDVLGELYTKHGADMIFAIANLFKKLWILRYLWRLQLN